MSLADRLAAARRSGAALAEVPALASLRDSYEVQERLATRLGKTVGWKVGATSGPAQAFLGIDQPIHGRIFAGTVHASPAEISLPGERAAEAEPEIVVRVAQDGVSEAYLGLEINRPSRDDALHLGAAFIVADNAANAGLVLGPRIAEDALADPAAIAVTMFRNGEMVSRGDAAAVLGDPLRSLRWLREFRAGSERPIRPGDLVATGAMARAAPLAIGDRMEADFGSLGRVVVIRTAAGKVMAASDE